MRDAMPKSFSLRFSLIGSALLAVIAFTVACSAPLRAPSGPKLVRVLSYNIHHGEGMDGKVDLARIAALIRRNDPDFVALQEVDRHVTRSGKIDELDALAKGSGLHAAFGKFMDYQGGEYGLGVLSRYPVDGVRRILLPRGTREPRSALLVRVVHPGLGRIHFVCLHLDWIRDDTARFAQAQALLGALRDVKGLLILAGDFNDRPESRTLRSLTSVWSNATKPEHARWTFPSVKPDREIDFVLYRAPRPLAARAWVLPETVASDHRPVLAELRIPSGAAGAGGSLHER